MDDFRRRPSAVTCHSDSAAGSGVAVPHRSDRTLRLHHRTGRPVIAGLGTVAALSAAPLTHQGTVLPPRPRAAPRARKSPQAGADSRQQPEADSSLASSALPAKRQARSPPGNVDHLTNHPVDWYPGRVCGLRVVIRSCTEEAPGLLDCRISFAPTAFIERCCQGCFGQGIRSPPRRRVDREGESRFVPPLSVCRRARAWHG